MIKSFVGALCLLSILPLFAFSGTIRDLRGTIDDYHQSTTIRVVYDDVDVARKECERLGFVVVEDYRAGKFLICELKQSLSLSTLAELVLCDAVVSVSPSPKKNTIDGRVK